MSKKGKILISIISIITVGLIIGVYAFLNKQDENTTLTILEKQWIENNKNNVIDLSIVNDIPIFNYNGEGLFFDFIDSLEKNTGLNFNKLSYNKDDKPSTEYSFKITNELNKEDILLYEDNYAIITKTNKKYNNLLKIDQMTIGVLQDDLNNVSYYLGKNKNLSFKPYTSATLLLDGFNIKNEVNAIIVPKTMYLKEILENDKINISYNLSDMKKYFVLDLGNDKKLNKIIKKYYKKWNEESFEESFNKNFSNDYFTFKQIYEQDQVNFKGKRYAYGFIEHAPYNSLKNKQLVGINDEIIKGFAKLSNIEISYDRYKNYEELIKAFNENKVDFYFNTSLINQYDLDVYNTVNVYDSQVAIISSIKNKTNINSELSLNNYNVIIVKDSKIDKYLTDNKIHAKKYDNVESLLKNKKNNEVIVLDKITYDTYMYSSLKDYKIDYIFDLDSTYNFTGRDITSNEVFNKFFDFYLSYINEQDFENNIEYTMFKEKLKNKKPFVILIIVLIIVAIIAIIALIQKLKPKKKKNTVSKEDKLKYIDMLTSLKNRNYLNDSMEKWDNSGIYPQSIIVIDLNNVAYINDNYGHEEGDNIIKEAASILIQTQIENSEIIRTNGNEFLIYLVEYTEKQVVSYIRKLNKELKELNHGFGAAIGYSIITDELKTIDDAINEATLDMKNNKEEIQN